MSVDNEKRIIVNFSSLNIAKFIKIEAELNGKSHSKMAEDLILFALREKTKNGTILAKMESEKLNKNFLPFNEFSEGLEVSFIDYFGYGSILTVSSKSVKETIEYVESKHMFYSLADKTQIDKTKIIKKIKSGIYNLNFHHCPVWDFNPDLTLRFASRIRVFYYNDGEIVKVKCDVEFRLVPVFFNRVNNKILSRLDLKNITYRKFSDIAKKGWNRKKYSHMIYINDYSPSKYGGYFAGLSYDDQDFDMSGNLNYIPLSESIRTTSGGRCYAQNFLNEVRIVMKETSKDMTKSNPIYI